MEWIACSSLGIEDEPLRAESSPGTFWIRRDWYLTGVAASFQCLCLMASPTPILLWVCILSAVQDLNHLFLSAPTTSNSLLYYFHIEEYGFYLYCLISQYFLIHHCQWLQLIMLLHSVLRLKCWTGSVSLWVFCQPVSFLDLRVDSR